MINNQIENLPEIWEDFDSSFVIQESATEVDGVNILAKVIGPAFFPESTSRNRVFYPLEAWEHALADEDFQYRLKSRLIFGTIGHNSELNDDDLRDGKASHIMTRVWIDEDEKIGKAEYLVLGTDAGRSLNTYLRAKSKLRVSTKAGGLFEQQKGPNGVKKIIPDSFVLERVDFVRDPGYKEALPELVESISKDQNSNLNEGKTIMSDDASKVQSILESRVNELKTENQTALETIKTLNESLTVVSTSDAANKAIIESYKAFGTVSAITESLSELQLYQAIGTVQKIHEALETAEQTIDTMTGTIEDLQAKVDAVDPDQSKTFEELGKPEDIKAALETAMALSDEVAAYRELGTLDELKAIIDNATTMTEALEDQEKQNISTEYGVSRESVDNMCSKGLSLDDIKEILGNLKGTSAPAAPSESIDPDANQNVKVDDKDNDPSKKDDEEKDDKDSLPISESYSSKLLQRQFKLQSNKKINESKDVKDMSLAGKLMTQRR